MTRARGRTEVGTSGKGVDSINEMLGISARFALHADMAVPDGYNHTMPQLLRYIADDVRDFYIEAVISKPGVVFPSPTDLIDWFYLQTVAGEVFYDVRERLLAAGILVLMPKGLDDDIIDRQLNLKTGTTAVLGEEILREPGISRDLLQKTAEVFRYDQSNRLSWAIVPIAMRDRRQERMAKHTSAHA